MVPSSTYAVRLIESAATFLARWEGVHAQLWDLSSSLKTLRIVLQQPGRDGNLIICCIDPMCIRAPIQWINCQIVVTEIKLPDGLRTAFRVADERADSEVLCSSIEIKEDVRLWIQA